jgi:hypothetical protein
MLLVAVIFHKKETYLSGAMKNIGALKVAIIQE